VIIVSSLQAPDMFLCCVYFCYLPCCGTSRQDIYFLVSCRGGTSIRYRYFWPKISARYCSALWPTDIWIIHIDYMHIVCCITHRYRYPLLQHSLAYWHMNNTYWLHAYCLLHYTSISISFTAALFDPLTYEYYILITCILFAALHIDIDILYWSTLWPCMASN